MKRKFFSSGVLGHFVLILAALLCLAMFCGCDEGGIEAEEGVRTVTTENEGAEPQGRDTNMSNLGSYEGISAETERQIKQAYVDTYLMHLKGRRNLPDIYFELFPELNEDVDPTIDDVSFRLYVVFDDYIVIQIVDVYHGEPGDWRPICIGGVIFNRSRPIFVWKDGRLYELADALDQGILPKESIELVLY